MKQQHIHSSKQAPVYVLGGAQTDFARNWSRENLGIDDLMAATLTDALIEVSLEASDIQSAHITNFNAELFCNQGLLGGIFAGLHPDLSGVPTMRHEAACASGSMGILSAMAEIESGRYDLVCVLGLEYMRNVAAKTAAEYLGTAAYQGREWSDCGFLWPRAFSDLAGAYSARYGEINYQHLGEIARINYDNATRNPNSQTRQWTFKPDSFRDDDDANPVVEGTVRRNDCGQVTDGGAAIFLASKSRAQAYAKARGVTLDKLAKIDGWGHQTAPMLFTDKLTAGRKTPFVLPQINATIRQAFTRAEIGDVFALDTIETHDCFAMTEYAAIDSFGITAPGESWKAVEEGIITMQGRLPMNPSGGLIGLGHPVGATGVRMMLDCYRQVTGTAGDYQVEGARKAGMLNIGGSTTAIASFVVAQGER